MSSYHHIFKLYHIFEDEICVFQPKGNTAEGQGLKLRDHFMQKLGGMARYRRYDSSGKTCSETSGKKQKCN